MPKTLMRTCPTCGHVNPSENISCASCLSDLTGKHTGATGPSQLAHLAQLVRHAEKTNRRLGRLTLSLWVMFALIVVWTVVAGIMEVGGPAALFRWPF